MDTGAMYCAEQIRIPTDLGAVMKAYTKACILVCPTDLNRWSANWFAEQCGQPLPFSDESLSVASAPHSQAGGSEADKEEAGAEGSVGGGEIASARSGKSGASARSGRSGGGEAEYNGPEGLEGAEVLEDQVGETSSHTQPTVDTMDTGDEGALGEGIANAGVVDQVEATMQELVEEEKYEDALEVLNQAIRDYPSTAELYFKRGWLQHQCLQNGDAALEDYNAAIHLDDKHVDSYRYRGDLIQYGSDEPESAMADYNKAVEFGKCDADTLTHRGNLHRTIGNIDEAKLDFDRALQEDPTFTDALRGRGDLYQYNMDNSAAAMADYEKVFEVMEGDVQDPEIFCSRGILKGKLGDRDGAILDLQAALELDPEHPDATEVLADLMNGGGEE